MKKCPICNSENIALVELKKDWGMTRNYYHLNTEELLDDDELAQLMFFYCRACAKVFDEFKGV